MTERLLAKNPLFPLCCVGFSAAMLAFGLLYAKRPAFGLLIASICIVYIAFGYAAPLGRCLAVILPVCAVVGGVALLARGAPHGLAPALQAAGRLMLLGLCAVPLVSLPPVNLTRCLTAMSCPRPVTLGMLVAIRFVPVLAEEMLRIREAMRTRGVPMGLNPACFYRAFLVPLAMRLISISEVLALSLETRGFDMEGAGATAFREVRFCARDAAFCAASALIIAWFALVPWAL